MPKHDNVSSPISAIQSFLFWEKSSRDTIDLKKIYIDIAECLTGGVLLSQIIYWYIPGRNGESKLKVQHEGHMWIAKTRDEWWEECRLSSVEFDHAVKILIKKNIIIKKIFKYNSNPTVHLRINWEAFLQILSEFEENSKNDFDIEENAISILRKSEKPITETTYRESILNRIEEGCAAAPPLPDPVPKKDPQKKLIHHPALEPLQIEKGTITMSQEAWDKLCKDFGEERVTKKVYQFSLQRVSDPKKYGKYVNHAATIRNWLETDKQPEVKFQEKPKRDFRNYPGAGSYPVCHEETEC